MVVHVFDPQHSGGRGKQLALCEFKSSLEYIVTSRHPGLYSETLSLEGG